MWKNLSSINEYGQFEVNRICCWLLFSAKIITKSLTPMCNASPYSLLFVIAQQWMRHFFIGLTPLLFTSYAFGILIIIPSSQNVTSWLNIIRKCLPRSNKMLLIHPDWQSQFGCTHLLIQINWLFTNQRRDCKQSHFVNIQFLTHKFGSINMPLRLIWYQIIPRNATTFERAAVDVLSTPRFLKVNFHAFVSDDCFHCNFYQHQNKPAPKIAHFPPFASNIFRRNSSAFEIVWNNINHLFSFSLVGAIPLKNVGVRFVIRRCRFRQGSILDRQSNYWQHDLSLPLPHHQCNFVRVLHRRDSQQFNWYDIVSKMFKADNRNSLLINAIVL